MIENIINVLGLGFCALFVILGILTIVYFYKTKERIKDIKSDIKYYDNYLKTIKINGKEYDLLYSIIKPETYNKIKSTNGTSIGFDIDTAYIPFARIMLTDPRTKTVAEKTLYSYKLRNELSNENLFFLEQVKTQNISDKNLTELIQDINKQNKEKELLKEF